MFELGTGRIEFFLKQINCAVNILVWYRSTKVGSGCTRNSSWPCCFTCALRFETEVLLHDDTNADESHQQRSDGSKVFAEVKSRWLIVPAERPQGVESKTTEKVLRPP